ncbi:hypothetical protein [Filimonas effusa]|uniref:Uncharacterized protein n=1 Tax=Filimonas effusa TaxID=2508721 RepID=A0A4Q1D9S7_9BACT|nr:hypothetical protein [Filimonas effusa]RXK85273.1 hypothetical protein ESB13_00130 [Filimonas effusa]
MNKLTENFNWSSLFDLDWGQITPDGYNEELNQVLHVFNFDMSSKENLKRILSYITGRIIWMSYNAPLGSSHRVVLDIRGQPFALLDRAKKIKNSIIEQLQLRDFTAEINIEILI